MGEFLCLQVHDCDLVSGMGKELTENIRRFQLEAAGADAGVAGEVLRLIDLPLHQQADADALYAELQNCVPSAQRVGTVREYWGGKRIFLR